MLDDIVDLGRTVVARAASSQAGIIDGDNPVKFNQNDPLRLWVIQVGIILIVTQGLALVLGRLRQPRVIAEVIAGILLGPTVLGRIPHFSNTIFPTASLPYLNLTSTIALVLFLFLVGLEIDVRAMSKQAGRSGLISVAGMLLPFGLGAAIARPVYDEFVNQKAVSFGHFLLFQCVALSITAFPVLCRILTELKLLDTTVGVVVLSAGVGNDVVGWVLLALTVALVNASSGLSALWVLLTGVAWVLFMLIPVKRAFHWFARVNGALESGVPTPFMMMITLLIVFASAFFTDIIGIHAIFGGFLAGLIVPHEGGFAIALTEKIEDLVVILLLPIYFTLSGLKTNLGLLDNGITWGYTILLIVVAFLGKFLGCALTARAVRFGTRESLAIGSLMSCKGLVELIVLNIGLQAGILNTRLFSMFVLMALVLTVITTPLTLWIYPASVRVLHDGAADLHAAKTIQPTPTRTLSSGSDDDKGGKEELEDVATLESSDPRNNNEVQAFAETHGSNAGVVSMDKFKSRLTMTVERIEHLPALMSMVQLTQHTTSTSIDALRLVELSERTSAVMRGSEAASELLHRDSLVKVFETFVRLMNRTMAISTSLSVVPQNAYANSVVAHSVRKQSDLIVLPWMTGPPAEDDNSTAGTASDTATGQGQSQSTANTSSSTTTPPAESHIPNPFASLFGIQSSTATGSAGHHQGSGTDSNAVLYPQFLRQVFGSARTDTAVLVDRSEDPASVPAPTSSGSGSSGKHKLFVPFFGGPDDRLALSFVTQLCLQSADTEAIVVRFSRVEQEDQDEEDCGELEEKFRAESAARERERSGKYPLSSSGTRGFTVASNNAFPDTVYGQHTTATRLTSQTVDNMFWTRLTEQKTRYGNMSFHSVSASNLIEAARTQFRTLVLGSGAGKVVVVVGRSRRLAVESHEAELRKLAMKANVTAWAGDLRKTLGDVGAAFVISSSAQILVFQAADDHRHGDA